MNIKNSIIINTGITLVVCVLIYFITVHQNQLFITSGIIKIKGPWKNQRIQLSQSIEVSDVYKDSPDSDIKPDQVSIQFQSFKSKLRYKIKVHSNSSESSISVIKTIAQKIIEKEKEWMRNNLDAASTQKSNIAFVNKKLKIIPWGYLKISIFGMLFFIGSLYIQLIYVNLRDKKNKK